MKFFADIRTKRNTGFVVLLVWLLALASSVANACLLDMDEPHFSATKKSVVTTIYAPVELPTQVGTDAGPHDDAGGSKDSCLKVCADMTQTLPKPYTGVDHTDTGPAPLVATLWTKTPNVVSAPRRQDEWAIPTVGPPFRVRYLRWRCSRPDAGAGSVHRVGVHS